MFTVRNVALTLTPLAFFGLAALPAAAQTYSFQADSSGNGTTYTGPGAAGTANFVRTAYQNVPDTIGNLSYLYSTTQNGVTLSYESNGSHNGPTTSDPNSPAALLSTYDYAGGNGTGHIIATGFAPNKTVTAYFYGINADYLDGRNTTFTLTNSTFTTAGVSATTLQTTISSFNNPGNYVTLTGTTDASGGFYATYKGSGSNGSEGDFNGVQFVVAAAPEPSQFAGLGLGILGLGGLMLRARRRSA